MCGSSCSYICFCIPTSKTHKENLVISPRHGSLFLSYNWKEKLLISKLEIRNRSLCVSCAFHSTGQEMWACRSSSWEYSLGTLLHKSTCTYHTGPTLFSAELSAWFLNIVIGFNIKTSRSYQELEFHLGQTRRYYARMQAGSEA